MTIKKQREVNLRDIYAEVAQLVERNLAKVDVASSSLVFRSIDKNAGFPCFIINGT